MRTGSVVFAEMVRQAVLAVTLDALQPVPYCCLMPPMLSPTR